MLNFNSILLFSEEPEKLVNFYKKVLNQEPGWSQGRYTGFLVGVGFITVGPHDKVKGMNKQPERIIFNLETANVKEEFKRIKNLGAKVVAEPYQMEGDTKMWLATLEDCDGNYFQLITPMKM